MADSIKFLPGVTIRWRRRRYGIVDYAGLDAIVGREFGKHKLERIPIAEAQSDHPVAPRESVRTLQHEEAERPEESNDTSESSKLRVSGPYAMPARREPEIPLEEVRKAEERDRN